MYTPAILGISPALLVSPMTIEARVITSLRSRPISLARRSRLPLQNVSYSFLNRLMTDSGLEVQ